MPDPMIASLLAGNAIGSTGADPDGFVLAEWQDPGGHAGERRLIAPRHLHHNDDEAWYVLEGTLCVQRANEEVEAGAGCAVFVARGTPHTYWNPAAARVRYLLVMTSNIYRLIQSIHANSDRTPAALQALFRRFDSEFLGW